MRAIVKIVAAIAVFAVVFAVTWFVYFPHSPWGKQEANLKLASQHRPLVEQRLRRMPGTELVKVGRFTGLGGSMSVYGEVADQQTAEAVIREVMATVPPVTVDFHLTVGRTDKIERVVEPDGAANGSQPIRSETNSTSQAAGSRR
jgi:hypothetical protein